MRSDTIRDVSDLMTGDLIAVRPEDRSGRALDILLQSGLHALPIIDEAGAPIGMVTTADVVTVEPDTPVGSRFAGPPLTVDGATSVAEAAAIMRREYVHHLVVTEGAIAVGMLSSHDLLKMLESED